MTYLVNLHLPATPAENYEYLRYFLDKGALCERHERLERRPAEGGPVRRKTRCGRFVHAHLPGPETDRPAEAEPLRGDSPSRTVDVSLVGITNLKLTATSAGGDGAGNYAVWGAPTLIK